MTVSIPNLTVGVLALQGAFSEHVQLLRRAAENIKARRSLEAKWAFIEVRTPEELAKCDALIVPGGESTTMSLVAARSGMLEPLRDFVKSVFFPAAPRQRADCAQASSQTHLGNMRRAYSIGRVCEQNEKGRPRPYRRSGCAGESQSLR